MAKQIIILDGKYYLVDDDTLEIEEAHIDKPLTDIKKHREILKIYIQNVSAAKGGAAGR